MKQRLKMLILGLTSLFAFGATLAPVAVQASAASDAVCEGLGGCSETAEDPGISTTIKRVINLLSIIVGIISVVMIIIGGLKYVTSQGDGNAVKSAKNTILYALVGLIVVALAQSIVRFVLNKSGATGGGSSVQTVTCPDGRKVSANSAAGGVGAAELCR